VADLESEDNLITYREFINAIKSLKNSLYKRILPRTLTFIDVLSSVPVEPEYQIEPDMLEEFYTFRYELNTIFRKHYYQDEEPSDLFPLGRHPLSKKNGKPLK